jgi:FkbM family methyltransferase
LNKKDYILKLRNGLNLKLRPRKKNFVSDSDIVVETILNDEYRLRKVDISNYKTILDIGAHIGTFSLQTAANLKKAKIYCYEALPENYNLLKYNVALNKLKNIFCFNLAVCNSEGQVNFFVSESNRGGHSLYSNDSCKQIKVKTTTLEKIFKSNNIETIDLLKMDCEGAEYDILLNTPLKYLKKIKSIVMEQHMTPSILQRYDPKSIERKLKQAGFKIKILKRIFYPGEGRFLLIYASRTL